MQPATPMNYANSRPTVVLTDSIHPDAFALLADAATIAMLDADLDAASAARMLRTLLEDAQGLIVRRQLPADIFDHRNDLRGVVRHGVGLDFIPVGSATAHGLPVANTPEVNADSVAEYAIGAMLESARRFRHFDTQVRQGNWGARKSAGTLTFELRGRTLGIVGFGAIGKRIAQIAHAGFGMNIAACTRNSSRLPAGVAAMTLKDLFASSDFIVLACPLTEQTRGMIDSNVFSHAKPRLVLVNVARGAIINEPDLVQALETERIGGAVLDVFATQPLPMDSRLRAHPHVVLTPHLAGMTEDGERAMGLLAVQTQLALIRGERPSNIVNPEYHKTGRPSEN